MCIGVTTREEDWGRLIYDSELDEFEAHTLRDGGKVSITRPLSVGCLITGKCNLKCAFCYGNNESLPKTELNLEDWERILRRLRSWGVMRVDFSGGEPTIRKDLPAIVKAALDVNLNVVISTNGLVLSQGGPQDFPAVRWHVSVDSGISEIHEESRLLRSLIPARGGFKKTLDFISKCIEQNLAVRVLTCIGGHNKDALFVLGERLALLGVREWNISRILRAGRAQSSYEQYFQVRNEDIIEQVSDLRSAFPFMRIRYSNRVDQAGYFLLVLPDGSLATQYTDGRDKVNLGNVLKATLEDLQCNSDFDLEEHGRKWISASLAWQPERVFLDPTSLAPRDLMQ